MQLHQFFRGQRDSFELPATWRFQVESGLVLGATLAVAFHKAGVSDAKLSDIEFKLDIAHNRVLLVRGEQKTWLVGEAQR